MKKETEKILKEAERINKVRLEIEAGQEEFIRRMALDIPDIHKEDTMEFDLCNYKCNEYEYN